MAEVQAIDYMLVEGVMHYNFSVRFSNVRNWVLTKNYEDFVELQEVLEKHYSASQLPYLTGPVRPWAKNSTSTAEIRLPKLENYLSEALSSCFSWSPRLYDVHIPDPQNPEKTIDMNKFLFIFLEIKPHLPRKLAAKRPDVRASSPSGAPVEDASSTTTSSVRMTNETPRGSGAQSGQSVPTTSSDNNNSNNNNNKNNNSPETKVATGNSDAAPKARNSTAQEPSQRTLQSSPDVSIDRQTSPPAADTRKAPTRLSQSLNRSQSEKLGSSMHVTLHPIMEHARRFDTDELALAAEASTITSQILVQVKDFTIYRKDHIAYHIHLTLYGHHWIVTKRFSEFMTLYESMVAIYGEDAVPSVSGSKVPPWRKLDPETGQLRQAFFDSFLHEVLMNIDQWEPLGLLANFDLSRSTARGDLVRITVYVNQLLFDFLDFSSQVDNLSGEVAAQAAVDHHASLPDAVRMAYDKKRLQEKRERMHATVSRNAQRLPLLSDEKLKRLVDGIAGLADDRDIMRAFRHLLLTGEVNVRAQALFREDTTRDADDGGLTPRTDVTTQSGGNAFDVSKAKVGLTALQLATITEKLFFNDTKLETISLFAGVLVDIDDLQAVFDTLWIHWSLARADVELILSHT